ncbi:methyl-accepting chemotaxis protein [Terrarubrum flagellatum]|uniref:methyl-accepting chemotaxis protein n=1 Tax=Terrirubrum flagellatum TaxID=2895980 RepID=UPI00314518ED
MSIRFSIRSLVLGLVLVMGGLLGVVGVRDLFDAWTRLDNAHHVSASAMVDRDLLNALQVFRSERGDTAASLSLDAGQLSAMRAVIAEHRKKVDAAVNAVLPQLDRLQGAAVAAAANNLKAAYRDQMALRSVADDAFGKPQNARDKALTATVLQTGDKLLASFDAAAAALEADMRRLNPEVGGLIAVKNAAWTSRAVGGAIAVAINSFLSSRSFMLPDDIEALQINQGRVSANWKLVRDAADRPGAPVEIAAAADEAQKDYFSNEFTERLKKLQNALATGDDPRITLPEWQKIITPSLNKITAVAMAAMDVAVKVSEEGAARARSNLFVSGGLLAATMLLVVGGFVLAHFRIGRPLVAMTDAMRELADGNLDVKLPGLDRKDEIGQVANAVERFKLLAAEKAREEAALAMRRQQEDSERQAAAARVEADAQEKVHAQQRRAAEEQAQVMQALGEGLRSLSAGDLTFRLSAQVPADYEPIKADFNAMVERIAEAMAAITASTREVSNASGEISASTTDLSQRTEEQAASLEQTSASMEEIAATVRKNAENAQTANQSANGAREVAERGGAVVATAVDAMARIEESSRKISDIIGVIDEIARQTNLLALNAAVEAARAGEAGRGFAVVASEVRSLAQRSSQAAKDIKELIVSSGGQVKDGVNLVNRAGAALSEIMESIKGVTSIVADIASASAEQSIGIAEVNKALQQMDEATQQNSALVEENAATAKTLESQARAMDGHVSYFRIDDVRKPAPSPQRVAPARAAPPARAAVRPTPRTQGALAVKDEWEEF